MLIYLKNLFGVIRVHMFFVHFIVKPLKLGQILIYRTERPHFTILANPTEKHPTFKAELVRKIQRL